MNDLTSSLEGLNETLTAKKTALSTAESQHTQATTEREDTAAAHQTALGEYDAAIEACTEALRLVEENLLENKTAFLQRSPVMI